MAGKANYTEKKLRILIYNNFDNNSNECETSKEQVSFMKRLESTLHYEFMKRAGMHECQVE